MNTGASPSYVPAATDLTDVKPEIKRPQEVALRITLRRAEGKGDRTDVISSDKLIVYRPEPGWLLVSIEAGLTK